jgi:hypothetical protein
MEEGPMELGKTLGRVAAVTGVTVAATAAMSLPANAATIGAPGAPVSAATAAAPAGVTATRTVGPYRTWEACDSDRRLYASRYGYKTYPCELHTNGYYYFKYEV